MAPDSFLGQAHSQAMIAAVAAIRAGGLVGMPTETVYGLAADALNPAAVLKIFSAKGRPRFDPLIVHIPDPDWAWQIAVATPRAMKLAAACWPGPLTLVLKRQSMVPDVVTSGLDTVGIRCPDHPLARELLRICGTPLAAPSANVFGRISPTTAEHVREQLGDLVDVILDGGPCRVGIESTVLLTDPYPLILRPGGLTRERIEEILGEPVAIAGRTERAGHLPRQAPGMLASHYAPRKPLTIRAPMAAWPMDSQVGVLAFRQAPDLPHVEVLSPTGNLSEAATRLFACLRRLDASPATSLMAELLPEEGLGEGINDRLRRAAGLG